MNNRYEFVKECYLCSHVTRKVLNSDFDFTKFISYELPGLDCDNCKEIKNSMTNYTINYSVYRNSNPIDRKKENRNSKYYKIKNVLEDKSLDINYTYWLKSVKRIIRFMQSNLLLGSLLFFIQMKIMFGCVLIFIILISEICLFAKFFKIEKEK